MEKNEIPKPISTPQGPQGMKGIIGDPGIRGPKGTAGFPGLTKVLTHLEKLKIELLELNDEIGNFNFNFKLRKRRKILIQEIENHKEKYPEHYL